ncbi:MAG: hypothetical protein ABJO02_01630, partial [Reichenbachiella sp.]
MKIKLLFILLAFAFTNQKCNEKEDEEFAPPVVDPPVGELAEVQMYLTTANASSKLAWQENGIDFSLDNPDYTITIDESITYQE